MKKLLPIFLGLALFTTIAHADNPSGSSFSAEIQNPFNCSSVTGGDCDIVSLFTAIADNVLVPIGSVLAVIFFVLSGFKFVTAQGDPGKITEARNALLYTAIGTAILLGADLLAHVISNTVHSLQSA